MGVGHSPGPGCPRGGGTAAPSHSVWLRPCPSTRTSGHPGRMRGPWPALLHGDRTMSIPITEVPRNPAGAQTPQPPAPGILPHRHHPSCRCSHPSPPTIPRSACRSCPQTSPGAGPNTGTTPITPGSSGRLHPCSPQLLVPIRSHPHSSKAPTIPPAHPLAFLPTSLSARPHTDPSPPKAPSPRLPSPVSQCVPSPLHLGVTVTPGEQEGPRYLPAAAAAAVGWKPW